MLARKQIIVFLSLTVTPFAGSIAQLPLTIRPVKASNPSPARVKLEEPAGARIPKLAKESMETELLAPISIEESESIGESDPNLGGFSVIVEEDTESSDETESGTTTNLKTEMVVQRFANGKPQVERWVSEDEFGDFVNHGKYTEYDPSGKVVASGEYYFGKQQGGWTKTISASQAHQLTGAVDKGFGEPFSSSANFDKGMLNGDWTVSDARGKLLLVWSFENGKRHGNSTVFNSKGEVIQSITYDHDLADGPAKVNLKEGGLTETNFSKGMLLHKNDKWYPAQKGKQRVLRLQENVLVPAHLNLVASDWNNNQVTFTNRDETEPVRHGVVVSYYSNGQRESESHYDQGKRSGQFSWWYSNGQPKITGAYQDDSEHGEWTWWHENGMKQASGIYAFGVRTNEWSIWNAEGRLVQRTIAGVDTQIAELEESEDDTNRY